MPGQATAHPDPVPHLPDLIPSMAKCWREIRDAQTEVDPFGLNSAASGEAREAIEAAVDRLTGQSGFLHLASTGQAGACWLLWALRTAMPKRSAWRVAQFDTLRPRLISRIVVGDTTPHRAQSE